MSKIANQNPAISILNKFYLLFYLLNRTFAQNFMIMGKGKLAKFADMERYENVFQYPYGVMSDVPFAMQGHWREMYFKRRGLSRISAIRSSVILSG